MSFIRTYAAKSLFSPNNMACIHISKLHSENHDQGIIIFIRILTTLSQVYTEIVDFHWVHIRSLNLCSTVNQYCETSMSVLSFIRIERDSDGAHAFKLNKGPLFSKKSLNIKVSRSAVPKLGLEPANRYDCDIKLSYVNVCVKFYSD